MPFDQCEWPLLCDGFSPSIITVAMVTWGGRQTSLFTLGSGAEHLLSRHRGLAKRSKALSPLRSLYLSLGRKALGIMVTCCFCSSCHHLAQQRKPLCARHYSQCFIYLILNRALHYAGCFWLCVPENLTQRGLNEKEVHCQQVLGQEGSRDS